MLLWKKINYRYLPVIIPEDFLKAFPPFHFFHTRHSSFRLCNFRSNRVCLISILADLKLLLCHGFYFLSTYYIWGRSWESRTCVCMWKISGSTLDIFRLENAHLKP